MTIGRAPGASLVLVRPVGLARARADLRRRGARGRRLQPRHVAGRRARDRPAPLRDGAKIRLGDAELRVERRRDAAEAGRTIVVRAGRVAARAVGRRAAHGGSATQFGMRPRVRSGYALKRLDASEGRAPVGAARPRARGTFLRLSDNDAWLFELLDGSHSLVELVGCAEQRFGADRAGAAGAAADRPRRARLPRGRGRRRSRWREAPTGRWRKLFKPREKVFTGLGPKIEALYRARRLGALHAPGADRAGGADRGRAGDVRLR